MIRNKVVRNSTTPKITYLGITCNIVKFAYAPKSVNPKADIIVKEYVVFDGEYVILDGERIKA